MTPKQSTVKPLVLHLIFSTGRLLERKIYDQRSPQGTPRGKKPSQGTKIHQNQVLTPKNPSLAEIHLSLGCPNFGGQKPLTEEAVGWRNGGIDFVGKEKLTLDKEYVHENGARYIPTWYTSQI